MTQLGRILAAGTAALLGACVDGQGPTFRNPGPEQASLDRAAHLSYLLSYPFAETCPPEPPGHRIAPEEVAALLATTPEPSVTWIGHATVLIRLDGLTILTDPVFADDISPLGAMGPCRFAPAALALADLPPVDVVLVSHDHYDHFEPASIRWLAGRNRLLCLLPLGVGTELWPLGCAETRHLDWGDTVVHAGVELTFLPAQHWSGRGLFGVDRTLWGSFAIRGEEASIYFAGDTGYGPHLEEIGRSHGPFDLALLPIGAYAPVEVYRPVHMTPEDALRALADLRARDMLPVHWGTFALGAELPLEPPERLADGARTAGIDTSRLWILRIGATLSLAADGAS